jgi:uncharacterized FlaG/YvyC family protein
MKLQKINEGLSKKKEHDRKVGLAPNGASGKTAEQTAIDIGVKQRTYERCKKIIENAPEELKEKVRTGQTSINYAYKTKSRHFVLTYYLHDKEMYPLSKEKLK